MPPATAAPRLLLPAGRAPNGTSYNSSCTQHVTCAAATATALGVQGVPGSSLPLNDYLRLSDLKEARMCAPSPLSSKQMMKRQYLQRTPLCWQCSMSRRLWRACADARPHGFRAGWVSFVVSRHGLLLHSKGRLRRTGDGAGGTSCSLANNDERDAPCKRPHRRA